MKEEADLLKALGEPTRLGLAALLAINGETCVCRLSDALGEPQFKVSRHLGVLRAAGVVEARREGTWIYYRLSKPRGALAESLHRSLRECFESHPWIKRGVKRASKTCITAKG
jgi:ArsR family transcriptional regulator